MKDRRFVRGAGIVLCWAWLTWALLSFREALFTTGLRHLAALGGIIFGNLGYALLLLEEGRARERREHE